MALSSIASEQTKATKNTNHKVRKLLDYLATHPNEQVRYHAFDIILNMHSDVSYLSVAGYYFLSPTPKFNHSIIINCNIFILCDNPKFVVTSAAEAKLGAIFMNAKEGKTIHLILNKIGRPQAPTPVHCDDKTATGIANKTVKKQCSHAMDMHFSGSLTKSNITFSTSNDT